MLDTKEKILLTALSLFAKDGFEAVSVSDIANELGLTKGALYRHYASKRAIFEAILARMEQRDQEQAEQEHVPAESADDHPQAYESLTPDVFVGFSRTMYRYWTEDAFAARFRKMLTLERYRSAEMAALYQQYLGAGPLAYTEDAFRGMGIPDPEQAAMLFYGPMYLLYSIYDDAENPAQITAQADAHFDRMQKWLHDELDKTTEENG